ncbi:unnamed protein product [Caenorhabditis auriculariae]|uniref:Uncharacterized protein n=1 Tax=Caenorhabditis auriculariae TaxID=2777116 RepID=A0A8S1HBW5_9PELO|nr:unnamed protein product [Caenorhabditis auriculariae]
MPLTCHHSVFLWSLFSIKNTQPENVVLRMASDPNNQHGLDVFWPQFNDKLDVKQYIFRRLSDDVIFDVFHSND